MSNKENNPQFDFTIVYQLAIHLTLKRVMEKNLFPSQKKGRPSWASKKLRTALRGIFWLLRTGHTWRQLPRKYGDRSTVHRIFQKMAGASIFLDVWSILAQKLTDDYGIEAQVCYIDSSDRISEYMQKDAKVIGYKYKGKSALRLSFIINEFGIPLAVKLLTAKDADCNSVQETLNEVVVQTPKPAPHLLFGDNGYKGKFAKEHALSANYILFVRERKNSKRLNTPFELAGLKRRYKVENTFERLYNFKRIKHPLERKTQNYLSWIHMGCALLCSMMLL